MVRGPKNIESKKSKIAEGVYPLCPGHPPPPPLQVLPAAQVMRGELSGYGAMGQSGSGGQSSIGRPSDKVERASNEGSLSLWVAGINVDQSRRLSARWR